MDFGCKANTESQSSLRKGGHMTSGVHLVGCATLLAALAKKMSNNKVGQNWKTKELVMITLEKKIS